jgi:glutaredoxin
MKEIKYFYLRSCPYCRKADNIIEELIEENPEFGNIKITKIEEKENPSVANSYDYYYVPCLWIDDEKLLEGDPSKESTKKVLQAAMKK